MSRDDLGDRMKGYEAVESTRKLDIFKPVYARIDGRAFSTFTRGIEKPFSDLMRSAMTDTTRYLVHHTHARMGYIQSDEINLVWLVEKENSDIAFSGKVQKLASVLASIAAAKFCSVIQSDWLKRLPHFDCRVFNLPDKVEAANAFLWRTLDARKNAIQAVAQTHYTQGALMGKHQTDMLEMIKKAGDNFDNYSYQHRYGTFVRRTKIQRYLTQDELKNIPAAYRPKGKVTRTDFQQYCVPEFKNVRNRVDFIFDRAEPLITSQGTTYETVPEPTESHS